MTDLTEAQARESVATAKRGLEAAADEIVRQISGRAWLALDYADWDEMREAEYDGAAVIVPRAGRPEIVARLREEGLSQQQVAETLGVDQKTVSNDERKIPNVAPSAPAAPPVRTDSLGRRQPTSKPRPAPAPELPKATEEPERAPTEWDEHAQRESERRAARLNLQRILGFLASPMTVPPEKLAAEYTDVVHEFDQAELDFAVKTMTAIATIQNGHH